MLAFHEEEEQEFCEVLVIFEDGIGKCGDLDEGFLFFLFVCFHGEGVAGTIAAMKSISCLASFSPESGLWKSR